ncbi:MAG: amino acid adenylation domain-containing protein [Parasporobacterium sp.]|nr:amino acid adenylation domain-containing protein [Parasporobacterium sp.]
MTRNVLDWLEATAKRRPQAPAFRNQEQEITYARLDQRSRQIGTFLAERVQRQQGILVFMEKGPDCLCTMMGIVRAGCFYTPLDPAMPQDRMKLIVSVLQPACIVCSGKYTEKASQLSDAPVFEVDQIPETSDDALLDRVRASHLDNDLLYVLFTSGSTGLPKGVAITHRSVIDFIDWTSRTLPVDEDCIFGNQAPLYFDNSVLDLYTSIRIGACVDFIPPALFSFPGKLVSYIREHQINTLFWVPSALANVSSAGVLEDSGMELRNIFFCGEVMHCRTLNEWRRVFPKAHYVNMYGPTEITDVCAYYIIDREFEDTESLPIGYPCSNTWIGLIDGEICVGGTCLSPGYYNAPDRTNEVFVQNPLRPQIREIIYKTGDLGEYNEKGELMFLGRKDSQIKRHGYRIELGEIETALCSIPEIHKGCCLFDSARDHILAFYTGQIDEKSIGRILKKKLPKYMLPDIYVHADQLPETGNGKMDRVRIRKEWENEHTLD